MGSPSYLCFVRHGNTEWNTVGRLQGRTDIPLSEEGHRQARLVAAALKDLRPSPGFEQWSALYTSPLMRTVQTAQSIGEALNLSPVNELDLIERSFGVFEGRVVSEINREYPNWRREHHRFDGLEAEDSLRERCLEVTTRLMNRHPGEAVIAVTHGAFLRAFFSSVLDHDDERLTAPIRNCSYSLWRYDGKWTAKSVNVVDHLTF